MIRPRVIPCLMLDGDGLYKTVRFKNPKYVGDPINALRIFNDKEVDELILVDATATVQGRSPNISLLAEIASECFMPLCYAGAVQSIEEIGELFRLGFEKVAINSSAYSTPNLVREAAGRFGSQSIVASIDVKKNVFGKYEVYSHSGTLRQRRSPADWAVEMQELGAGEILLTSIDREGTGKGFDLALTQSVIERVSLPVIAHGGAGNFGDISSVLQAGASAAAAGSLFVFHGKHRAVLISYPASDEIERLPVGNELSQSYCADSVGAV